MEDGTGEIKVYCRIRPFSTLEKDRGSHSILKVGDEYTLSLDSESGVKKEFRYDRVFTEDSSQEHIFENTKDLIQSAMNGHTVGIFAYGQMRSGKTYTLIGNKSRDCIGIASRAFEWIFKQVDERKSKTDVAVTMNMLELRDNSIMDLLEKKGSLDGIKIKKDQDGTVLAEGATVKQASTADELNTLIDEGYSAKAARCTNMNLESMPRSHIVIIIGLESTDKTNGSVIKGKLSLVDLAAEDRPGNVRMLTGAMAKESIGVRKSLSSLVEVMNAVSRKQSFVPYRNSKLTWLLQDSIGGNAKTLMFVNVSSSDYTICETEFSLRSASRAI